MQIEIEGRDGNSSRPRDAKSWHQEKNPANLRTTPPSQPFTMASKKRPADAGYGGARKTKQLSADRASKRQKKANPSDVDQLKSASTTTQNPLRPAKSLLQLEERAFPRGGGSVLTPLEHKQVQNEAARDVLFEQSGTMRAVSDEEDVGRQKEALKPLKKRKKSKASVIIKTPFEEPRLDRVEGLSYRRLVPGSIVLGQVTQITSRDLALALPNNLTGYIPLTAISDPLEKRVEKLLQPDEDEVPDEEVEEEFEVIMNAVRLDVLALTLEQDVELKKMFSVGQYLRAYVTSNGELQGGKTKRRIELSIKPQHVNSGMSLPDCVVNSMVQAAVVSVEDRGLVMDVGLEEESAEGFIHAKDLGASIELDKVEEGAVLLCLVVGVSKGARTILKLSPDMHKAGEIKSHTLNTAPTIHAFSPGVATEMMVTDVTMSDLRGKVMGLLDVTADHFHSGYPGNQKELEELYKIGSKVKVRVIFALPKGDTQRIGVSVLPGVLGLSPSSSNGQNQVLPLQKLPLSSIVEKATVTKAERKLGLFLDVHVPGYPAFAHISQLSDKKVELLASDEGPYKVGSKHQARVIAFNPMDGLFMVSLEQHILDQPYLRIEDIPIGAVVKGTVEKVVLNDRGVGGVLIKLADGIIGLAPTMHLADAQLQHPEGRFPEGFSVTARVLSTDPYRKRIRLTLKKSLVKSSVEPWTTYDQVSIGDQSPGIIVNLTAEGAVIQFYGDMRAFLPVAEMSEAYIKDPREHFRIGQTVNVRVLSVDSNEAKMVVSCKDPESGLDRQAAFDKIGVGQITSGTVIEVSADFVRLELSAGLKGILKPTQLSDGSEKKNTSALKQIRAGQKLSDLLVLEKDQRQLSFTLSRKPSLLKASRNGDLLTSFAQVKSGKKVDGFVRNIAGDNIFVQFAGGLVGLLHKSELPEEMSATTDFGLTQGKSLSAFIINVKPEQQRFFLTMNKNAKGPLAPATPGERDSSAAITNAVDGTSTSLNDFYVGRQTKARVRSVKRNQLNVMLADGIEGRVSVSEAFDSWDDIQDKKHPLRHHFNSGDVIDVQVLGVHNVKTYDYLPITRNLSTKSVLELSAKKTDPSKAEADSLTIDKINVGDEHVVFIHNHKDGRAFVNIRPNIRGSILHMDLTTDWSLLMKVTETFPIGSALKATVISVDLSKARLVLSAVPSTSSFPSELAVEKGKILPGLIASVNKHGIQVRLNTSMTGFVPNYEIADDYDEVQQQKDNLSKQSPVRVCVLQETEAALSKETTRATPLLSMRPSLVLSSSLPVKDPHVESTQQLNVNDICRGFVNNVTDLGVFVALGPEMNALVREADISDEYLKDWKSKFESGQLVKGKIIFVDHDSGRIKMSLKPSHLEKDYVPQITWNDVDQGQVVTGKIRKVLDHGVIIVVDNSANVSGLCHQNDMADTKIADWMDKYEAGDKVKAVIKKLDTATKKLHFSLKASVLKAAEHEDEEVSAEDMDLAGIESDEYESDDGNDGYYEVKLEPEDAKDIGDDEEESPATGGAEANSMDDSGNGIAQNENLLCLGGGGFHWDGRITVKDEDDLQTDTEDQPIKKKKRKKPEIQIDRTGDLDKYGPQSVADFERLLLGQPNSSELWIQYMAFQLQLNEVEKARAIADRALKMINMREETEKTNMWIALLNLENTFGSDETFDASVARAQEYVDKADLHERLATIFIETGKYDKAEDIFARMIKIKDLTATESFWLNYATFLMTTLNRPDAARALNQRALQSVDTSLHLHLTAKFAALEFRSPNGDAERGRTIFEGLLNTYPGKAELWDQFVDLEKAKGEMGNVGSLFERMVAGRMKPRRAKYVFKRWVEFEEALGEKKHVERVRRLAEEWVERRRAVKEEGKD